MTGFEKGGVLLLFSCSQHSPMAAKIVDHLFFLFFFWGQGGEGEGL